MTTSPQGTNFRQSELDKFAELANRWWDAEGPQKPLHALNPVRLEFVAARRPLAGARVLDVGCGGGLLSEAMARAGAEVTAIDLADDLVRVARLHALESGVKVDYRVQAVEALAAEAPASFDAVTCMEMLEHVPDPGAILQACATLLKPGGQLFVSTLNRTPAAFALALIAFLLDFVPIIGPIAEPRRARCPFLRQAPRPRAQAEPPAGARHRTRTAGPDRSPDAHHTRR